MAKRNQQIYDDNQEALAQLWPLFEAEIPDNETALNFVLRKLFELNLINCHCGNNSPEQFKRLDERRLECFGCARKIRFMAATRFRYVKHLKAWLGAIYLKERRVLITSYRLTRLCNIAAATAHNIVTTLSYHLHQEMEFTHGDNVHTASLNAFLEVLFRRSLISASYIHPSKPPEKENSDDSPVTEKSERAKNRRQKKKKKAEEQSDSGTDESTNTAADSSCDELNEDEKLVFEIIKQIPISQDSICKLTHLSAAQVSSALVMLELMGLINPQPGNLFTRRKKTRNHTYTNQLEESMRLLLKRAFQTIEAIYGGVSRKYLQLYLAAFWCHQDGARWKRDSLLKILLRGEPVQIQEILGYVSPLVVALTPKA
ncbi:hypothetical protein BH11CYA1_BH11CYA1_41950 [soil metagenome]